MRVDELGEFPLIARLTQGRTMPADVAIDIGDDTSVLNVPASAQLIATCDAQVEGQHFLLTVATPEDVGAKSLAVNLSDVAAMGAVPRWALVSLLIPPSLEVSVLDGIYAGMRELAARWDVGLVGGNVSSTTGPLTIDVTLLGVCPRGRAITRAGGHPGDTVVVAGTLGAAAAGLLALVTEPGVVCPEDAITRARLALVRPMPLVAEGQALAATGVVTAMLDVSDGLTADLAHLCERSGVGAELDADAIPVDPAALAIARAYGRDPLDFALAGGEDYALVCAVRPDGVERVLASVRALGTPAHAVGHLIEIPAGETALRLRARDGHVRPLAPRGWDHLRRDGGGNGHGDDTDAQDARAVAPDH